MCVYANLCANMCPSRAAMMLESTCARRMAASFVKASIVENCVSVCEGVSMRMILCVCQCVSLTRCHDARKHLREEDGGESVGATFLDLAGEEYW